MWAGQPWDGLTQWSWEELCQTSALQNDTEVFVMLTQKKVDQNDHKNRQSKQKWCMFTTKLSLQYLLPSGHPYPFKAALPTADQLISPTGNQQISARLECSWPSVLGQEASKERPSLKTMIKASRTTNLESYRFVVQYLLRCKHGSMDESMHIHHITLSQSERKPALSMLLPHSSKGCGLQFFNRRPCASMKQGSSDLGASNCCQAKPAWHDGITQWQSPLAVPTAFICFLYMFTRPQLSNICQKLNSAAGATTIQNNCMQLTLTTIMSIHKESTKKAVHVLIHMHAMGGQDPVICANPHVHVPGRVQASEWFIDLTL